MTTSPATNASYILGTLAETEQKPSSDSSAKPVCRYTKKFLPPGVLFTESNGNKVVPDETLILVLSIPPVTRGLFVLARWVIFTRLPASGES